MLPINRILDPDAYDLGHVIADAPMIRRVNPQRFEWEQLSAVVYDDAATNIIVGYKDLTTDEFWCHASAPDRPHLPRVLMCEVAAQLCSYHASSHGLTGGKVMGFGGLDGVRFRRSISVPSRLVIVAKLVKLRRGTITVYRFQCFVDQDLACDGELRGIGLPENLAEMITAIEGVAGTGE